MANSSHGLALGAELSMAPHPAAAQPWTGCTKGESQSVAQPAPKKKGFGPRRTVEGCRRHWLPKLVHWRHA